MRPRTACHNPRNHRRRIRPVGKHTVQIVVLARHDGKRKARLQRQDSIQLPPAEHRPYEPFRSAEERKFPNARRRKAVRGIKRREPAVQPQIVHFQTPLLFARATAERLRIGIYLNG